MDSQLFLLLSGLRRGWWLRFLTEDLLKQSLVNKDLIKSAENIYRDCISLVGVDVT